MGRRFKERFHLSADEEYEEDESIYPRPPVGTCRVQAVRSVCDWSHGVLTERSIQSACTFNWASKAVGSRSADIQLIREANHFIYIGKQLTVRWLETKV